MANKERPGLGAGMAFGSFPGANKNIHKYPLAKSAYSMWCVCVFMCAQWGRIPGAGSTKETKERR